MTDEDTNPYTDNQGDDALLGDMERAEAWAEAHMVEAVIALYGFAIVASWLVCLFMRVPRDTLGPEEIQGHWVPAIVHACVAAIVGFIGCLERGDIGARTKLMVLAVVATGVALPLISALVEAVGQ